MRELVAAALVFLAVSAARGEATPPVAAAAPAPTAAPAADSAEVVRFHGQIARGESYQRRLPNGLRFVLRPESPDGSLGWILSVFPTGNDSTDFLGIATPPYHGVNPRDLEGWHFRNAANTGPNRGDVNAPGESREFLFVTTPDRYRAMSAALDVALWPNGRSDAAIDSAMAAMDAVPKASGTLNVTKLWLGNLVEGQQAWIDSMRFEVELHVPRTH